MATQTLIKHGSELGYREHIKKQEEPCERCRNGHRVFDRQYRPAGKRAGLHYERNQVLDQLYNSDRSATTRPDPARIPASGPVQAGDRLEDTATGTEHRPLSDRLTDALKGFTLTAEKKPDTYVETDEIPDYLQTLPADPEPSGDDWAKVKDDQFGITAAGEKLIEENMGTYLSVIGMTLELVDPYCGPILAENLENIVKRWTKVIAHYPKAAQFFMSETGGVLMDWIGAIQATWPFLFALYEHHLSRNVRTIDGRPMRVHSSSNGQRPDIDATMPPMPDTYEYTVGTP